MPKPYSDDLRERVAAAVMGGRTCREVAALFSVSVSSVVKWTQRLRRTGSAASRPPHRRRLRSLESEREWIARRLAQCPELPLAQLLRELRARGIATSYGSLWRIVRDQRQPLAAGMSPRKRRRMRRGALQRR